VKGFSLVTERLEFIPECIDDVCFRHLGHIWVSVSTRQLVESRNNPFNCIPVISMSIIQSLLNILPNIFYDTQCLSCHCILMLKLFFAMVPVPLNLPSKGQLKACSNIFIGIRSIITDIIGRIQLKHNIFILIIVIMIIAPDHVTLTV
jgi:hypothetical protein